MEAFQRAQNPWGQDVLVRISWDLFYAAVIVGVLFMIGHLIFRAWYRKRNPEAAGSSGGDAGGRVVRHSMAARTFHWVMAVSMLVLLITGFLPQVGLEFSWVTAHWIAGIVLIASIIYHIVHATFFQSLRNIWIGFSDVKEFMQEARHALGGSAAPEKKPGKYPVDHKMYHHMVTITGFGAMITGVLMMFRIENPLVTRNPYLYSDGTWGWIYVIHGLSGVALVTLTMAHVYFAILPEKRWITWSMIRGWISRSDYLQNHDPERWAADEAAEAPSGSSEAAPAATAEAP